MITFLFYIIVANVLFIPIAVYLFINQLNEDRKEKREEEEKREKELQSWGCTSLFKE